MMTNLSNRIGAQFSFNILSETRAFATVEEALSRSGIQDHHGRTLLARPTPANAISRAINYLTRTCQASIEFLPGSKWRTWTVEKPVYRVVAGVRSQTGTWTDVAEGRNPNFCLKITVVKKLSTDTSVTWRVNVADRNKHNENMGHVLNVTYANGAIHFAPGSDVQAHDFFGADLEDVIRAEFDRFLSNYDDQDVRDICNTELAQFRALKVLKNTNAFISTEHLDRAKALYKFVCECGHEGSWLGLTDEPETRESLLKDLKSSIMADMDAYEEELDEKLNTPTKERKRGEAQRERMYNTQSAKLDDIMGMADYYSVVFGAMAEGIVERRDALRTKARELLTKNFDAPGTIAPAAEVVNTAVEAAIAAATDASDPFSAE